MPPQVVNMDVLLTQEFPQKSQYEVFGPLTTTSIMKPDSPASSPKSIKSRRRKYSNEKGQNPFKMLQTLLFPGGASMAYCNEETLSSSFLILDGLKTISLADSSKDQKEAIERWGKRLETNICVGKVSYEYREADEVEQSMSNSSSDFDALSTRAEVVSQHLEKIPLVLDSDTTEDGTLLDPDRYLPPSHKMVADALKHQEYNQAIEVYEDILQADKERYGDNDLVCAIDMHNLGVTSLLANEFDTALYYFQEAVLLKRACLGHSDTTASESLVEIGIILYMRGDYDGSLKIFKEAHELYRESSNLEGVGRTSNNIACVYYKMGDLASAIQYLQEALKAQRMVLGISEKAESSLVTYALSQSNLGYLMIRGQCPDGKCADAISMLEESLLVLESVLGDENMTIANIKETISSERRDD